MAADYRAGLIWAAVLNAAGGIRDSEGGEARTVLPQEAFPSLTEILGAVDKEPASDVQAFIAALKDRGARDERKRK